LAVDEVTEIAAEAVTDSAVVVLPTDNSEKLTGNRVVESGAVAFIVSVTGEVKPVTDA